MAVGAVFDRSHTGVKIGSISDNRKVNKGMAAGMESDRSRAGWKIGERIYTLHMDRALGLAFV
jgi:hypothetical protein